MIRRRLQRAAEESEGIESYDYVLVNDDLEACYQELLGVIRSAHFAAFRNEDFIRERIPAEDLLGMIHWNDDVIDADRRGMSPFDFSPAAVEEIKAIKQKMEMSADLMPEA